MKFWYEWEDVNDPYATHYPDQYTDTSEFTTQESI